MDLSDLRIFRAVVREGGVTRAAERLHRVQSNITTRIRQLEENLGVPLFIRQGKRLHLAPAGEILVGYADRLLALADEAEAAVQESRPHGVLKLGAMESTAAVRLPGPLSAFHRAYPNVVIELRTGNPQVLAAAVLNGDIDAALVAEPIPDAPFDKVPVFDEKLIIISSIDQQSLTNPEGPAPAMVAFEHGCPHRKRLETWFENRSMVPSHTVELGSYHAMLSCVLVGMGIALMPDSVLSTFPDRDSLTVHALPPGEDHAETVLIWRKGGDSPKIRALRDILVERPPGLPVKPEKPKSKTKSKS